jgi:hypothetical protein
MKTKVISFRVTPDEYDALQLAAQKEKLNLADVVYYLVKPTAYHWQEELHKVRKRAKDKARRDAKKAAANGAQ